MEGTKGILAIETSGRHGSVAILSVSSGGVRSVSQIALSGDERTAQALAPAIQSLLRKSDWAPRNVRLVAVALGPGSFTGLRIGVTTAKAFAYATEAEIVGVNTLEVLATQTGLIDASVWAILDAQRQELFAAKFRASQHVEPRIERQTSIIAREAWLEALRPGDHVIGPPLQQLSEELPAGVQMVSQSAWQPMAHAVGRLAWQKYCNDQRDDVWQLVPQYFRASAAEEKNPV
ncbi:MAG TPA: tRNA (adenosine(37)-N6)-threonylcarbamoyltransferase complex dimerization subunit type 1 TsaB [Lacipirellulaceae bacterium]|jgi:tRNA threonylcarbamoyladenosine biosynthesis protein TsaB|nr:tRNA (adenosine(37)-N6)-threonylcarbamoyltransferase complex dimerization subunit type 1 TsaB [Lacipirellulaceae bacterium]